MKHKEKVAKTITTAFLMFSIFLATISLVVPMASAAGSITLTPSQAVAGSSVTVTGTGFGATQAVGIGLGQEVVVTGEAHNLPSPSGTGPFTVIANHYPFKPGSFSFHCVVTSDTNVVESDYTDNGDGTLTSSSTYALNPFVNYVTGAFGRSTTSAWDGYTVVFTANYTYYQYIVTPAANVTTSASGTFTAPITVPAAVANGNYYVTAVDVKGNKGVATLTVSTAVPESLTFGLVALLSSVAVAASYFWKRPKTADSKYTKL
jgi:hypothetical protein